MRYKDGAGVIVVRNYEDDLEVLLLLNHDGTWDLPKGGMEPGESPFDCAVRETFEETSIDDLEFAWGTQPIVSDNLNFYIARSEKDPVIRLNPVYGIYEHVVGVWVDPTNAIDLLPDFLKPFMTAAISRLRNAKN